MEAQVIKPNTLTTIQISTYFYTRLQEFLIWIISNQDADMVKRTNERILSEEELTGPWEMHYFTLLSLINDIEEAARNQNNIESIKLPEKNTA